MTTKTHAETILNIDASQVAEHPYPHVASDTFLDPDFYARLKAEFPDDEFFETRRGGGRTGRDFYSADVGFHQFVQSSPAWREFYGFINSPEFVHFVVQTFRPYLAPLGCRLDPEKARFTEYAESREELMKKPLLSRFLGAIKGTVVPEDPSSVNDLYVRFDVEQADVGYQKPVHCDIQNRLASLLVFFCDADEIALQGGDLQIHELLRQRPPRSCERHPREEETRVVNTIRPRENTGVLFLCSNNSYHSVTPITALTGYRKFIYLNVSSRARRLW